MNVRDGSMVDCVQPVRWLNPLTRGLRGWWLCLPGQFGSRKIYNLVDAGRHDGRHGTLTSVDFPASASSGWTGANFSGFPACQFDGTNDHLLATVRSGVTAYSYSFRIRAAAPSTANIKLAHQYGTTGDSFGFAWNHTSATFVQSAYHQNAATTYTAAKLTSTLVADTDYWVGATWDGTNVRAYLNGRLEATTATGAGVNTVAGNLSWSARPGVNALASKMSDMTEWDRALTPLEMQQWFTQSLLGHPETLNRIRSRAYSFGTVAAGGFVAFPRPRGARAGMMSLAGGMH